MPGGVYHVILRGNGGQNIFFIEEDRNHIYLLLQEGISRFGHRIHAFCLMTNHIHMAIQVADIPLSKIIHNLSFRYTRWINDQQKRFGHLFQGRYRAILVDMDNYLLELIRYIHLNPVRAGIVPCPEDYSDSSHGVYIGKEILPWLTTDWALSQFAKQSSVAGKHYQSFINDGIEEKYRKEFHGSIIDSRFLGNDKFIENTLAKTKESASSSPSLDKIIGVVCAKYDINKILLTEKTRNRRVSKCRAIICWLALEMRSATLTEISKIFGRDVSTMSIAVRRLALKKEEADDLTRIIRAS